MRMIFLVALLLLSGCVAVKVPLPNGEVAEYIRIGNQKVESVTYETKDGTKVTITGQMSETEMAFKLGAASVGVK